jgi:RNA polymerase sigma-70 factor (family 1)
LSLFGSYSDEQLLETIRNGNDAAYAELFNRHWDHVYRMIYSRIRNAATTEEMAQEIFMKLWDKRNELAIENFPAYLYTCVKHRCLNYIESRITQQKHWVYYREFLSAYDDSTNRTIELNDLRNALDKGLETIPEKSKMIFRLSKLEGKSLKEISEQMKLSQKAVQYHLTRSARELRIYLKEFIVSILLFCHL